MPATRFGPGTVSFTVGGGSATSFEQEVKGGGIGHDYEDVGEAVTYLDGTLDPAGKQRMDKLTLECDFDLGSAGFYAFLATNDLMDATVDYVPNTANGASWTGTVRLQLPDGAVADEYGSKLSGTVEMEFVGFSTFAPAVP
jgi:hypothetical protein